MTVRCHLAIIMVRVAGPGPRRPVRPTLVAPCLPVRAALGTPKRCGRVAGPPVSDSHRRRPGGRTVSSSFNFVIASRRVSSRFRVDSESFRGSRLLGPLCDCPRHSPVPTAAHSDRPLVAPNLKVRNRLCSGLRPGALWYLRQATWRYPSLAGRRLPRDCHS